MAANVHKKVVIKPGDTVIFSSNPIPGNEKAVSKVINELYMKGANVIFQDVHVSGTCMPGGDQADLYAGTSKVCDSGTWRVPSFKGTGEFGRGVLAFREGSHFHL